MGGSNALLKLIIALEDRASAGLKAIQSHLGAIAGGAGDAARGFASFLAGAAQFAVGGLIQKGIEGIAASLGDLRAGLIDGPAEFERYNVQFGVLLGNADAAKQRLQDLAQFGATTPFELPEVVRADKILQSFGLHATEAAKRFGYAGTDIRRIAGDTAAGTGASFEEISTYIGKFASGATGETIARFQELGIVTKAQLTQMGLAFDKGGSLIINSQEDLDRATGVLLKAMEGKFGGMMAAQSNTFEGMLSNLADWKAGTLRTLGQPIFEVLKVQLQGLLAWLPSQQPRIEAFAQVLGGAFKIGVEAVTGVLTKLASVAQATWFAFEVGRAVFSGSVAGWLTAETTLFAFLRAIGVGAPIIRALAAAFNPVLEVLRALPVALQEADSPLELLAWAFHVMLPNALDPFVTAAYRVADAIRDGIGAAFSWLTGTGLPALQSGWAWLTDTGLPAARQGFDEVAARVSGPLMAAWAWLTDTGLPRARDRFDEVAGRISGPLTTAWAWLTGTGLPALQTGWGWLVDTGLPAARQGFEDVAGRVSGALQPALDWLQSTGLPAVQGGLSQLRDLLAPLRDALQPVIDGFGEGGLQGAFAALPGALPNALKAVQDLRTELSALALEGLGKLLEKLADMPQLSAGLEQLGLSGPSIDAVTGTLRNLGQVLETAGGWVRQIGQWFLNDLMPPLAEAGRSFGEMLMPHLERLSGIIATDIMPILGDFGRFIGENLPGFLNVVSPLLEGLVDTGLSGLELALKAVAAAWNDVLKPAFEAIGKWLEDLTGGWDNLARGADKIRETFGVVSQGLQGIANGQFSGADLQNANRIFYAQTGIGIPGFANGVTNFGGGLAMVGERGPELVRLPGGSDVIPAGGFSTGGGGTTVNVNLTVQGSVTSERDLVEAIRAGLIDIGQNNVTAGIP